MSAAYGDSDDEYVRVEPQLSPDPDEPMPMEDDLFGGDSDDDRRSGGGHASGADAGGDKDADESKKDKEGEEKRKIKPKRDGPSKRMFLSEDMICGKDGLLKLQEMFKDFKLKGRGHELQDMNAILFKLERWVHILHPAYQFNQTLERIEFLGTKKRSIKTLMKKIRMGMVNNEDDIVGDNMPVFDLSDHEMETNGENLPETPFPESNLENDPFGAGSDDDNDDWMLAALDKIENKNGSNTGPTLDNEPNRAAEPDSDDEVHLSQINKRLQTTAKVTSDIGSDSDGDDIGLTQQKKRKFKSTVIGSDSGSDSDTEGSLPKKKGNLVGAGPASSESDDDDEPSTSANAKPAIKKTRIQAMSSDSDDSSKEDAVDGNKGNTNGDEPERLGSPGRPKIRAHAFDSDSDADNEEPNHAGSKDSKTIDSDSDDGGDVVPQKRKTSRDESEDHEKAISSDSDSENGTTNGKIGKNDSAKFVDSDSEG